MDSTPKWLAEPTHYITGTGVPENTLKWLKHRGYAAHKVVFNNILAVRFRKDEGPVFTCGVGWTLVDIDGEVLPEFTNWPEEGYGVLLTCCPHCKGK